MAEEDEESYDVKKEDVFVKVSRTCECGCELVLEIQISIKKGGDKS